MTQAIQITRAGKMTETIGFRNPQGLEKFVEAFAGTETPPTEDHILSFIKENPGAIMYIDYRNKNVQLHDGANGVAAWRRWDENSQLRREMHYQNGKLHDGANGAAAVRSWDQNGKFIYAGRYSKGMSARVYETPEGLAVYEDEMKTKKALAAKLPPGMKFV